MDIFALLARHALLRRAILFTAMLLATTACAVQTSRTIDHDPVITLDTSAGPIRIRLFDDAAPDAVARIVALACDKEGYFDGLTIDYTSPHVEIRTQERSADIDIRTEIDAISLSLDTQRLVDDADAMNVVQSELIPAYRRALRGHSLTPKLESWLEQWFDGYDPAFLIGATRKEINEALGYQYASGLSSRPVTRGTVSLMPRGRTVASTRLSIALTDMPQRTGKWMVVGEVMSGLDLADRISSAPLDTPPNTKPLGYRPDKPVVIASAHRGCPAIESTRVTHLEEYK